MRIFTSDKSARLYYLVQRARCVLRDVARVRRAYANSYWVAAIYLEDKAYGGSEEGGWWYSCGSLHIASDAPFPLYWTRGNKPEVAIQAMEAWCTEQNKDLPSISSVLSEGRYCVRVHRNNLPTHWPKKRPYYS